jgi:glutamate/tyrosine decarboxylase-like PLP-dependent enzyme
MDGPGPVPFERESSDTETMTEPNLIERIRAAEAVSRQLDPAEPERVCYRDQVLAYAERFLQELPAAPAYRADSAPARELRERPIGEEPTDLDDLLGLIGRAVDMPGINPPSGGHLGYIPGGGIYTAALGDYLAAVTNRYVGVRYASPGAVEMEEETLRWMADLVGFPDGWGGALTAGGSVANLIGIVTARDAHRLRSRDFERAVVYHTAHVHHCVDKALRIAGMGECVRRTVDMDERYRMRPDALATAIDEDRRAGLSPWLVVASAGTTDVGAIDPLEEVGEIARERGLWYHVDAAYGGFFALCDEVAPKLRGMALADTVVLDPHKGLNVPFGCGALLARSKAALYRAHRYHANYMQDTLSESAVELASPGELSLEFSKHFRGPRLWLPLKLHGLRPFRACLDEKRLLARYFHQEARRLGFEVGPEPELSVVTYAWNPTSGDPRTFNERLLREILADGSTFVSTTMLDGTYVLRAAILVFRTRLSHIQRYLEFLKARTEQLEAAGVG